MSTATVQVALPKHLRDFASEQAAAKGYRDAAEYIKALLTETKKQQAREKVETLLRAGLKSPVSELNAAEWDAMEREALETRAKRP